MCHIDFPLEKFLNSTKKDHFERVFENQKNYLFLEKLQQKTVIFVHITDEIKFTNAGYRKHPIGNT